MAFLEVKKINKKYPRTVALNNLTFSVEKGEILTIIGPSGNGKTTLLRCLNMLESVDSGDIKVEGKTIYSGKLKKFDKIRNRDTFGLVFQNLNLFPQYNVFQNVKLAFGLSEKFRAKNKLPSNIQKNLDEDVFEILSKLKLADKAKSYPFELSGGERQRVAIARAVVLKPKILCFDEPTSALDPNLVKEVSKIIKNLRDDFNLTIIIVTHDIRFAKLVSDKIMFLEKGTNVKFGKTDEIFNSDEEVVKMFLESN